MNWLDALIMGLVQGLAEFLPISSSGHLEIMNSILGLKLSGGDALEFDIALHVATALSTIVILWHEFSHLCSSFFRLKKDENTQIVLKIILSCIPVAIVGVCFEDYVESLFGGNILVVGICLLVTAVLLAFTHLMYIRRYDNIGRDITWLDALIIGVAQALAVLPGLSRSGATISTGILLGDKRQQVAKFSFLMVLIPILGKAVLEVHEALSSGTSSAVGFVPLLVGFLTAFIVGCLACKWMIKIVKNGKLYYFAIYCAIVGIVCLCF
ncbi:MAG: undecaprenyl-diphosphate phosphatase [Muribaculaceae bacterium]|nr:undecaprenyl-diphosphate phosphatase [Muribaculaceae bacterium]